MYIYIKDSNQIYCMLFTEKTFNKSSSAGVHLEAKQT